MALLMEDDADESKHKHFNYDKIVEQQNLSKKKRKKLLKKGEELLEDDEFQVKPSVCFIENSILFCPLSLERFYLKDNISKNVYSLVKKNTQPSKLQKLHFQEEKQQMHI